MEYTDGKYIIYEASDAALLDAIKTVAAMSEDEFESLKLIMLKNNEHELCNIMENMRRKRGV